jgi:RNA polymerase sigma-B factor
MITRTPAPSSEYVSPHHDRDVTTEAEELAVAALSASTDADRAHFQGRMVLLALPLADSMARRYAGRGIETDDLLQVARTALVLAAQRYRPGTGSGFAAFAVPTISGELKRWFRDHGWSVRPPRRVQELRPVLSKEEERLRSELAREPSDDELAAAMGVDRHDLAEVRLCSAGYHATSLDTPAASGGALADIFLITKCATDAWDTSDALGRAIATLTTRQRRILYLSFVEEQTQAQIGAQIGVSQMQVSRILRTILDDLRQILDSADGTRRAAA